jgi:hypothetical protein
MSGTVVALPVSVEQIASAIRQMAEDDRERLFDLVPDLRQVTVQPSTRTVGQAQASVARLRAEVLAAMEKPLSPDEPFLGNLTLDQYHALPDEEKAHLWDKWADLDLMDLEEQEVAPDALPAG